MYEKRSEEKNQGAKTSSLIKDEGHLVTQISVSKIPVHQIVQE